MSKAKANKRHMAGAFEAASRARERKGGAGSPSASSESPAQQAEGPAEPAEGAAQQAEGERFLQRLLYTMRRSGKK